MESALTHAIADVTAVAQCLGAHGLPTVTLLDPATRTENQLAELLSSPDVIVWVAGHGAWHGRRRRVTRWMPTSQESEQLRQIRREQRQALVARGLLDQLVARARLRCSRDIKPQIPIVDTPIEPMAPCALTFS